ncbi:hypothetical protein KR018_009904, partial [Drosophila ironensis]
QFRKSYNFIDLIFLHTASPLAPGNVVINGDCRHCNVHGG